MEEPFVSAIDHIPSHIDQPLHTQAQEIRAALPFFADTRFAEEHDGDLALAGAGRQPVIGLQGQEPFAGAGFDRKQSAGEAAQASQGGQPSGTL